MDRFIILIIFIAGMFILQYILTFLQMNSFKEYFRKFISKGKVAIGIKKGGFRSGAIVMFSVDDLGYIKNGAFINGVTVFARFREEGYFNKMNIRDLDKDTLKNIKISSSLKNAILNAKDNYIKVMNGEEIPMERSPLSKLGNRLSWKK